MFVSKSTCSHSTGESRGHWLRSYEYTVHSYLMIMILEVDPMCFKQCYKKDLDGEDDESVTDLIVAVSLVTLSH